LSANNKRNKDYKYFVIFESFIKSILKDSLNAIIDNENNTVRKTTKRKLLFFTLKKESKDNKLNVIRETESVVVYNLSNHDIKNLRIILNKKDDGKWEIVDLQGDAVFTNKIVKFLN